MNQSIHPSIHQLISEQTEINSERTSEAAEEERLQQGAAQTSQRYTFPLNFLKSPTIGSNLKDKKSHVTQSQILDVKKKISFYSLRARSVTLVSLSSSPDVSLCPLQCCNLLLVETLKDPLCFRVSDQTIPKQQHIVQVSDPVTSPPTLGRPRSHVGEKKES